MQSRTEPALRLQPSLLTSQSTVESNSRPYGDSNPSTTSTKSKQGQALIEDTYITGQIIAVDGGRSVTI